MPDRVTRSPWSPGDSPVSGSLPQIIPSYLQECRNCYDIPTSPGNDVGTSRMSGRDTLPDIPHLPMSLLGYVATLQSSLLLLESSPLPPGMSMGHGNPISGRDIKGTWVLYLPNSRTKLPLHSSNQIMQPRL